MSLPYGVLPPDFANENLLNKAAWRIRLFYGLGFINESVTFDDFYSNFNQYTKIDKINFA